MFGAVLTQVTGLLESGKELVRFWLASLGVLAIGGSGAAAAEIEEFQELSAVLQIAWLALGLTLVAVVASILAGLRIDRYRSRQPTEGRGK